MPDLLSPQYLKKKNLTTHLGDWLSWFIAANQVKAAANADLGKFDVTRPVRPVHNAQRPVARAPGTGISCL